MKAAPAATAAEVAALRARVETLEKVVVAQRVKNAELTGHMRALEGRLARLEGRHKPKGPPRDKPVPDQPAKRAGGKK